MAMNFIIATPVYENYKPWFVRSLWRSAGAPGLLDWIDVDHLYTPTARESLVEMARDNVAEAILWIDADMAWEPADLAAISQHDYIQVGKYPARKENIVLTEGAGFLWTPMWVFDRVPQPWFFHTLEFEITRRWIGEDIYFCRKVRSAGLRVDAYESDTLKHAYEPGPRSIKEMMEMMK